MSELGETAQMRVMMTWEYDYYSLLSALEYAERDLLKSEER